MKHIILCLSILMLSLPASAQGPHPHAFPDEDEVDYYPPPPHHGPPPAQLELHPAAMKWIERLRHENPKEHERFQQLRGEDPRAFRRELYRTLKRENTAARLRKYPRIIKAIQELPQEQREELMERLTFEPRRERAKASHLRHGPPFPPGPEGEPPDPDFKRLLEAINDLSSTFHAETNPIERERIAGQARELLGQMFDLRSAARAGHIERIEQELARLKQSLARRQSMRESIVEQRLRDLLGDEDSQED